MLTLDLSHLKGKKNLLAFSAGVDSSALFFLLLKYQIKFDIAIVNYGTRETSDEEEMHAKALAKQHKLFCHSIKAPTFHSHFEKQARDFRYEFFESLITIEGYDTLITAHQLNDQLEWLLMRLSKGAGLSELLGLEPVTQKGHYALVRPLLTYSKEELLHYLQTNAYPYFVDESNSDESYERNKFRKHFSDALISEYKEGIQRSMEYLRKDKEILESGFQTLYSNKLLHIVKLHAPAAKVKAADLTLKKLGYLLSAPQRQEIEKESSLVIGGAWSIALQEDLLFIAPFLTVDMPKKFKELCRVLKVPAKIRPYLFKENINPKFLISNF
ncbi:tRNA lysidine(34) synthetase TilS [Sulfurovum sp. TSL1]|uniref:tRNA lysidine(34) synthetase TilS n=1 Tax=Sulfurovum sp. TSL1 TaxID=2826994 RepID=UPI001CC7F064|nr:tRNA lysidine(34) synthetase TilS [Sulfurovum sp. TSL1]GIT98672.1 tRNA(Ile)-lysidine synthase [Sulfurovum sp. TSL1]